MKKAMIGMLSAIVAAVLITLAVLYFVGGKPLGKTVSFKGYEISVPTAWVAGSDGTLTDEDGTVLGKYTLINTEPDMENTTSYAGIPVNGDVKTENVSDSMLKNTFSSDQGKAVQYFVKDIPNPEPYAVSIALYRNHVSRKTCDAIAESFKLPELGNKPPMKNITVPLYDDIAADKTAKMKLADGTVSVKNASLLEAFIKMQEEKQATGLDVLSYITEEDGTVRLESWTHLEHFDGRGYLYTYYDKGDGVFTYDNNPQLFDTVTKEVKEQDGITVYHLKTGETETSILLEIPMNPYRDNADALLEMKTDASTAESVTEIINEIMPEEKAAAVKVEKSEDTVTLTYSENAEIDPAELSKEAAVIFSLASDVNTVVAKDADGKRYVLTRDDVMGKVEMPKEEITRSPEDYAKFAESVEQIPPAEPKKEETQGGANGAVVYSKSIYISSGTMVTHPRTGEKVPVGPYAQKMGYGHLLDKSIQCTIRRSGSGYMATATCGGAVIASQYLADEAALRSAIASIGGY